MQLENEKYLVTTDGKQFILQIKEVVKDSPLLEDKSKIGSIKLGSKSYYSTIPMLLNGIVKNCLLTNDEIQSLDQVNILIEEAKEELKMAASSVNGRINDATN